MGRTTDPYPPVYGLMGSRTPWSEVALAAAASMGVPGAGEDPPSADGGSSSSSTRTTSGQGSGGGPTEPARAEEEDSDSDVDADEDGNGREVLIELDNVHKTYLLGVEGVPALRGVSVKIYKGEWVVVYGTSGGGKTTLLNIIGTIDKPTKGEVRPRREQRTCAYVYGAPIHVVLTAGGRASW
jgi:ABC-type glutathione transport system ATPase component